MADRIDAGRSFRDGFGFVDAQTAAGLPLAPQAAPGQKPR